MSSLSGTVPAYSLLVLGLGLGALVVLFGGLTCYFYQKSRRHAQDQALKRLSHDQLLTPDVEKGSSKGELCDPPSDNTAGWPLEQSLEELVVAKRAGSVAGTTATEQPDMRTFVATDIEGSTGLWEWNGSVMDAAQEAHDTCLRMLLYRCNGEEVHTEGDAFCCAFASAVDAVVWCLTVQQALLGVDWPAELLQQPRAKEETVTDADGVTTVVFKGLRIRMGVHTSSSFSLAPHAVTGQRMYRGSAPEFADKLCGMGKGGQILMCGQTYQLICKRLGEIAVALDCWQQEQAGGGQMPTASQRLNSYGQLPDYLHMCRGSNCSSPMSPRHPSAPASPHDGSRPGSAPLDAPLSNGLVIGGATLSGPEHFPYRPGPQPARFVPLPPLHSNPSTLPPAPSPDPSATPLPDPTLSYCPSPAPPTLHARSPRRHPKSPRRGLLSDPDDDHFGLLNPDTLRERSFHVGPLVHHSSPSALSFSRSPAASPFHPSRQSRLTPRARRGSSGSMAFLMDEARGGVELEGEEVLKLGGLQLQGVHLGGARRPGSAGSRHSVDGGLPGVNLLELQPALGVGLGRASQTSATTHPGRWGPTDMRLSNSISAATIDLSAALDTRYGSVNSDTFFGRKMQRLASELTDVGAVPYAPLPLLVDMGKHSLQWGSSRTTKSDDQRQATTHIVMVVSSALRGRLQYWPGPLDSSKQQQDAGYFDAPCTLSTARWVGSNIPAGSRPFVTFGFCSICPETAGRLPEDKLDVVTEAFTQVVRSTLSLCGGYECQERGGTFMLAFQSMRFALEWSLVFQLALMQVDWDFVIGEEDVLPEMCGVDGETVLRGLRGRVGLMHGEVVKVTPHATTGRADYFGPVLNRAARVHSASHGGQVLAEAFATYKAVREWQAAYNQAEDVGLLRSEPHPLLKGAPLGPVGPKVLKHIKRKLQYSRSLATQHTASWKPPEAGDGGGRALRPGRSFTARDNLPPTSSLRALNKQNSWGSETRSEAAAQLAAGSPLVPRQRLAVHVYDRGTYQFKGVDIFIPAVSVLPADLDQREALFPAKPLSSKAKLAKPGAAPMQRVFVEIPDVTQVELLRASLSPCPSGDQPDPAPITQSSTDNSLSPSLPPYNSLSPSLPPCNSE